MKSRLSWPRIYPNFAKKDRLYRHAAGRTQDRRQIYHRSRYFHSFKHYHKITAAAVTRFLFLSGDTCCAFDPHRRLQQHLGHRSFSEKLIFCAIS